MGSARRSAVGVRALAVLSALGMARPAPAYEPATHFEIGARAVDVSSVDRVLKDQLGLLAGKERVLRAASGQQLTLRDWIAVGSYLEDDPPRRAINHFHNPLRAWPDAGLSITLIGQSSIHWQQNPSQGAGGTWTWPIARARFHDFLTGAGQAQRDAALADVARALGNMAHLIQDATSPPHTRNDAHLIHDGYEATMERFRVDERGRWVDILFQPPVLADPAIFTPTGDDRAPAQIARLIDSDTAGQPAGNAATIGNAEYTNGGYVSDDTIFTDFAFPRVAALGTGFFEPAQGQPGARRYFPKVADGDPVSHFVAEGTLWERLQFSGQLAGGFILDDRTYEAAARRLVPRAVGYSAALIDRFFQPEIEIAAPARHLYARTEYVAGNTGAFTKLTFRVRKSTPGPGGTGEMTAVLRYRRGLADLVENPLLISNDISYAVSAPQAVPLGSGFTELTFDFANSPLPTNSADVFLTVVYRGPAGAEQDAVLYGTRDLLEPDPVDVGNVTDYDCFGPQPFHVADFSEWPPFDFNNDDPVLNPQPRDLTDPKDGFPELFGPSEERGDVFVRASSLQAPQLASPTVFDYRVPQLLAQPDPQFVRFFVLQDQPRYTVSWRVGSIVERGFLPNFVSGVQFLTTQPFGNTNRVFVDANGVVTQQVDLPLLYRGVNSLNLNILVVNIPRFNACFAGTLALPPSLSRIEGTLAQP
jgi:hypothetical protein